MKFYSPKHTQLDLGLFPSSLSELNKSNRWVVLGDMLPWTELEKVYNSKLGNQSKGAGNKPARMVLAAMIIKHKCNFGDAETIRMIQENPYMQYMCGLSEYTDEPIFNPSLFVTIRKRITDKELNEMTVRLLNERKRQLEAKRKQEEQLVENTDKGSQTPAPQDSDTSFTDSQGREHEGVLKIDATCADAEMRYPVDVDIIYDGCRKINEFLTKICDKFEAHMPPTRFKKSKRAYKQLIKQSKKRGKQVRETIGFMLACLRKDIRTFLDFIKTDALYYACLSPTEKNILTAIFKMCSQQEEMYAEKKHTCADRILSIFQPHVRAILRGKARAKVEFGAKIGASIVEGYTFIDHHSWNAYNEGSDLSLQIELYQQRFGHLPATILADKIYMNRANRELLKELEIQTYCKPLGRPPKDPPSDEVRAKMVKAVGERNEIEATFGTGKRIYRANNIRAKLPNTARCWTGMCYFVKNVMKFLRELCLALTSVTGEIGYFLEIFVGMARLRWFGNSRRLASISIAA